MSNKKTGNDFEAEFAKLLANKGFWVYNTINKAGGQPADIIAAICGRAFLIDCKVCEKDNFRLDRVEENQINSMLLFNQCENAHTYFAFKFSDGEIRIIHSNKVFMLLEQGVSSLSKEEIKNRSASFDWWVKTCK